ILISGWGWRTIFLVNLPLGVLAFVLARRYLREDRGEQPKAGRSFDYAGTLILAGTLAAYALAMTLGRGSFGPVNRALLAAAALGVCVFVLTQTRAASPLIRFSFIDPTRSAGFAMSALVSTVMMTTLVVGPFYLTGALGLDMAVVGLVLSVGPVVVALLGVPAGRLADRYGASSVTMFGLGALAVGCFVLSGLPETLGVWGYIAPIVVLTSGYALFQTANNTAVMTDIPPDRRGLISGMLNLSRNLGLIAGASAMGAVFAFASSAADVAAAPAGDVASAMRVTFGVAGFLI